MSDVYLTGSNQHTAKALELLTSTLVVRDKDDRPISFPFMQSHTEESESRRIRADYCSFDGIEYETKSPTTESSYLVIVPWHGVAIHLRAEPLIHFDAEHGQQHHTTYIDHEGDFLHIVAPFYYFQDRHKVSYAKYCVYLGLSERKE